MALCFWRHSHPDYGSDADDPVLSDRGKAEAFRSAMEIKRRFQEQSIEIYSSPLRRCQETAHELARLLNVKVAIEERLRLKDSWDSSSEFKERLDDLLGWIKKKDPARVMVFCSHSDVLLYFLTYFGGPRIEMGKSQFFWVTEGRVKEIWNSQP